MRGKTKWVEAETLWPSCCMQECSKPAQYTILTAKLWQKTIRKGFKQIHFTFWTNACYNLDKYILNFDKYISKDFLSGYMICLSKNGKEDIYTSRMIQRFSKCAFGQIWKLRDFQWCEGVSAKSPKYKAVEKETGMTQSTSPAHFSKAKSTVPNLVVSVPTLRQSLLEV